MCSSTGAVRPCVCSFSYSLGSHKLLDSRSPPTPQKSRPLPGPGASACLLGGKALGEPSEPLSAWCHRYRAVPFPSASP